MLDSLTITLIFIVLTTVIGAFFRRLTRDKCLMDLENSPVALERTDGTVPASGFLKVENTGLEFIYAEEKQATEGHIEASFILYKYEYPQIQVLIRYHDQLSEIGKQVREKELTKTYHPTYWRRKKRNMQNVFKTIGDSIKEVLNILAVHFQKKTSMAPMLKSQDKYMKQINQTLVESVGTAYEPLLEKYIGHLVAFELIKGEELLKYTGVLKDYTSQFVEIMDVNYAPKINAQHRLADIVVPQKLVVIRHLAEKHNKASFPFWNELKSYLRKDKKIDQS